MKHPRTGEAAPVRDAASCEPGAFDAARAYLHVERLHFPRRVGTRQERRAARYILRTFARLGLDRRREPFVVPHVPREVGVRLVFAACAAVALIGLMLAAHHPLAAIACWLTAAALVNSPWRVAHGFGSRWSTGLTTANLVATLPEIPAESAPARVVFMAHYDTKSQVLPTGVRVGLVVTATIACGALVACAGLALLGGSAPLRGPLPEWLTAALIVVLAALAANITGNRSPGALDNGTGLGTLLELARTWRPRPGAPIEAHWIATGAEELGLDGARAFLRRHEAWWRAKPTLLVNLDSVGAGNRLYLAGEPDALRLAQETADGLGLGWARLRVLGAGMDHEPFAARGLSAVSLLGDVVGRSLDLHTTRDTLDLVEHPALERAGNLAGQLAWAWADRHRPAAEPGPEVIRAPHVDLEPATEVAEPLPQIA